MVLSDKNVKNRFIKEDNFEKNGKFKKGNIIGTFPKTGLTLKHLTKLVMEYEKTKDHSLLEHYAKRLYKNDQLLAQFIQKYVPQKTINELTGADGSPLSVTLKELIYPADNDNLQK